MKTSSTLENGRVVPPNGMEIIVSDHCNISCRQCNHFSPVIRKWNVDPARLSQELAVLSNAYRPRFAKLIGGEPLLHPRITEVARVVRQSGIAEHLMLVTNGMLLTRMADELWQIIDELEVSNYPGANLSRTLLAEAKTKARQFNTRLTINAYPNFRYTISTIGNDDEDMVNDIYTACKIANVWGCHGLYKNRLYKCPQSMYIPIVVGGPEDDFVELSDQPDFPQQLLDFLNAPTPLWACQHCLGTAGKQRAHKLIERSAWRDDAALPVAAMLDQELLQELLVEVRPVDDCKTPMAAKHRVQRALKTIGEAAFARFR